ncbi:putative Hemolysin-type calcium-binding region [Candidatus Terasakiella magnetica]|nr:putative Hemolysin-type calcium-binding region [Candidatus Terasakiella magnetica]
MAEDVAGGEGAGAGHADDRTLLDDLTVLAQPVGAAPQTGEARQAQDSERGGGVAELAAIHQGTPDLAARFIPAVPDQAGARDAGDANKGEDVAHSRGLDGIENAKPIGPENTPRADGSTGDFSLTLPKDDSGRATTPDASAPSPTDTGPLRDGAAPQANAAPGLQAPLVGTPAVEPETHAKAVVEPKIVTTKTDDPIVTAPNTVGAVSVEVSPATGDEDTAIALKITASATGAGDSLSSITMWGVPSGAVLNHGTLNPDGSWSLSSTDLAGLTLTPPHNFGGTINLTVSATATDSGLSASSGLIPLSVTVERVADAPIVTTAAAHGLEDQAVPLNIATALTDLDGSESITAISITGVPTGASLNHGTHNADGSWSLSQADLTDLKISLAQNDAHKFTLMVSSTSTEMGSDPTIAAGKASATTVVPLEVTVERIADVPTLTVTSARGNEDTAIALDISPHLTDLDGSEAISAITITGVPEGAVLNHGHDNGGGSWTLSSADLAGLKITPPSHSAVDFTLTVTTTSTEVGTDLNPILAGHESAVSAPVLLRVTVDGVAKAPLISESAAAVGNEDTRIALNLDLAISKADETLTGLTLSGVPANSHFYANGTSGGAIGHDNGDGTWSFSRAEVATIQGSGLFVQPPTDWNDLNSTGGSAGMTLTATVSAEQTDPDSNTVTTNSSSLNFAVHVAGVADKPTVAAAAAQGNEDTSIPLTITPHLTDVTNTEAISAITITGVPVGASLNHGTHNADGSWTLRTTDLTDLKITPPSHSAVDFTLTVTTTSSELGGNVAVRDAVSDPVVLRVTVDGVAKAPLISESAAAVGNEDTRIALNLDLAISKADETLTGLTLSGVPANSHFYANGTSGGAIGHDNGDGTWSFSRAEVATIQGSGLFVQPPTDWNDLNSTGGSAGMTLTATVSAEQTDPDSNTVTTNSSSLNFAVHVAGVADKPTVAAAAAQGNEDTSIPLTITPHLTDVTNTEAISAITITGVPVGASLNHGTHNADGSWTLRTTDLTDLKITPPSHSAVDFTLTVTTTSSELGGNVAVRDAVSDPVVLRVTVDGVAKAPTLTLPATETTNEDTRVSLNLALDTSKADETLTGLTIVSQAGSTVADQTALAGSSFTTGSGGSVGHYDSTSKSWVFTQADVAAIKADGLYVQTPKDWNDWSSAGNASGLKLSVTLTASEYDTDSQVTTTATTTQNATIHVYGVADTPSVTALDQAGTQNLGNGAAANWIPLSITPALADTDGSESITAITITGVPTGATLNAGTNNGGGSWTLTNAQLSGLKILPKAHDATDFTLQVTTTSTESGPNVAAGKGSATSVQVPIHVSVEAVAEAPVVTQTAASGNEDTRINVNLTLNLADSAESFTGLSLTGVLPNSHFYSASSGGVALGTDLGGGSWSFTSAEISAIKVGGLFILPPSNWSDYSSTGNIAGMQFTAALSATKTDADSQIVHTATTTQALTVNVLAVADTPTAMVTSPAHGSEYNGSTPDWIALSISTPALVDTDASELLSVTIAGVPTGAQLNHGTYNGTTKLWSVAATDLADLKVQPAAHNATDFTLTITATATERGVASHIAQTTASTTATLKVTVDGVADTPVLTHPTAASGNEDTRINLNLTTQLADSNETLSMTLSGVQSGSAFYTASSGGSAVGSYSAATGLWSFSATEMNTIKTSGLFILPPKDWSDYSTAGQTAGMNLTATLTSTQVDPDNAALITTATAAPVSFAVNVLAVADAPSLTAAAVSGTETTGAANWIPLSIATAVTDTDASESISSVVISQVPNGATLALADGTVLTATTVGTTSTYTLSQVQLAGLKIQPALHDAKDFTLSITSTSTEGGVASHIAVTNASTTTTLKVTVAGVAETPTLTQTNLAVGDEDSRINLNLNPQLTDSQESLSMTLAGVQSGSTFYSAASGGTAIGTLNAGSGIWSFSSTEMNAIKAGGLYLVPPKDWSDWNTGGGTTGMQVSATLTSTETDPESKAVTTASAAPLSFTVEVKSVADTPTVTVTNVSGQQNDAHNAPGNWIALSINPAVADKDGSESISSVTISQVPNGAKLALANGTELTATTVGATTSSYTLSQAQLAGLKILPPAHSAADFNLSVVATATEGGDLAHISKLNADSAAQTIKVTVTGLAEAPVVTQTSAVGNEDTRINVNLSVVLPDSTEVITGMTIKGAPSGALFYASDDAADSTRLGSYDTALGAWTFTASEMTTIRSAAHGLFVQPPKDWSDYDTAGNTTGMKLVTAVSVKEVDPDTSAVSTNTTTATLDVSVKAVADAPTVSASAARGNEDSAIALTISPHLTDVDGSESISAITISGVPTGAVLNHGHSNGDGSWTLTKTDLTGLTITPPADSKTAFTLHVTATSTEGGNAAHIAVKDAVSAVVDLKVTVDAVADTPVVVVGHAQGFEDTWISLPITITSSDTSGSETVAVTISGIPAGVVLNHGTYDATSHNWTVSQGDLADLKILPVHDDNSDFTIQVAGIAREPSNGTTFMTTPYDLDVKVVGTPEAPHFSETAQAVGLEDTRINLNLAGSLTDNNEVLTLKLAGIPAGAHFFSASGAVMVNGSDTTAIGHLNADGSWSFTTAEVVAIKAGGLFLQPPTDWSDWSGIAHQTGTWSEWNPGQGGIPVTATLTSTDTDRDPANPVVTTADTQINFTVHVTGVADAANGVPAGNFVAVADEDNGNTVAGALVDLGFGQLSLKDADGSEHLSVVVSGLPAGTHLEFVNGVSSTNIVPIAAGKWSIEAQYLSSLRLRVGENVNTAVSGPLHLHADVVTTEVDGNIHMDSRTVDITINPVTDNAHIGGGASGSEEQAIALNLSVSGGGIGETVTAVTLDLGTLPGGVVVKYGSDVITADASGHYTLTAAQMADPSKFTVTAPKDWSDYSVGHGIPIGVSVTSHDHTAADLVTTSSLTVHVAGVADAPTLSALSNVVIGPNQPQALTSAALDVSSHAALTDTDGSERLWMVIDGLPNGALLTTADGSLAGFWEGDGRWMVTPDQWDAAVAAGGFRISIPHGLSDASHTPITSATVTVTALSTERDDGSTAATTTPQSFTLTWDNGGAGGSGVTDPAAAAVTINAAGGVAVGNEDSAIALNVTLGAHAGLNATLVIDAPSLNGGSLSAGLYDSARNTWVVREADIAGLKITPAHNWNSENAGTDLALSAHVVYVDPTGGGTSKVDLTIPVHVNPITDFASVWGGGSGVEDSAIALGLGDAVGAAGESVTQVVISAVPAGAVLQKADGTALAPDSAGGATYTVTGLSAAELAGLKLVPPHNWSDYSGTISLNVAVTTKDHSAAALTVNKTVAVHVSGITDAADVSADAVGGSENQWVDLSSKLHAALTDTDGSEAMSVVLANVPDGAVLNHGFNNGDGTWRLNAADLSSLKLLMPKDFNGSHEFTLQGLTWEKDGSSGLLTTSANFTVTVDAVAGTPSVSVLAARGNEDSAIALNISASVPHLLGSDAIDHITITGIPAGAVLNHGHNDGDGSWTLSPADLSGLTITPPANSDAAFNLQVTVTAAETDSISHVTSNAVSAAVTLAVQVDAVADKATVSVQGAAGDQNTWIDLKNAITPHLTDADGSEAVSSIIITGMPVGAVLNHGVHNADGSWTVAPADLGTLKLLPATNDAHNFTLSAQAVTTEHANGASTTGDVLSFTVTVDAVAAPVSLGQSTPAVGGEDTPIALNLSALVTDPGETPTLTISGVLSGAHFFNAANGAAIGTDNHNGTWTFSKDDIADIQAAGHGLFLQPPTNWSDWSSSGHTGGMPLVATLTATKEDPETHVVSTTSSSLSFAVHVDAVADAPVVTVTGARGAEDSWISLDVTAALGDTTGSEYLASVTLSDLPPGATLNQGTNNGDGSWTLQPGQLTGLKIQAGSHAVADFTINVAATARDLQNSDAATSIAKPLHVVVDAVANTPVLTHTAASSGAEDTRINLNLTGALSDSSEALTLVIAGAPAGSQFFASSSSVAALGSYDGVAKTWSFTFDEVKEMQAAGNGLFVLPPSNWSDWNTGGGTTGMALTATLTSTQLDPDSQVATTATAVQSFAVHVASVADVPTVTVNAAVSGAVDSPIALSIAPTLADNDGSESISAITISGVPTGALLNHGTNNGDGSWTLTAADLNGLTVTPAPQNAADMTLHVTATATDGGSTALSAAKDIVVTVVEQAHAPVLSHTAASSGSEDSLINLNLTEALANAHETLSLSLAGIPANFQLLAVSGGVSIGTYHADTGAWTFSSAEVAQMQGAGHGLFLQPPANWSDWNSNGGTGLAVTATLTSTTGVDPDTGTAASASSATSFVVHVAGVADIPNLAATTATSVAGASVALNLSSSLVDSDGSESLKLTITGLPGDASLNHGTYDEASHSWTLNSSDLSGLSISTTANDAGHNTLHVTASATEADTGSVASKSVDLTLNLNTANLGTLDAGDQHMLHFDHLPVVPANSGTLAEFVFGSLDGLHSLDVAPVNTASLSHLSFDIGINGSEHHAIAAGSHGFIDKDGIHISGSSTVESLNQAAFIDPNGIHGTLTFDNNVALHIEGLDKITF